MPLPSIRSVIFDTDPLARRDGVRECADTRHSVVVWWSVTGKNGCAGNGAARSQSVGGSMRLM